MTVQVSYGATTSDRILALDGLRGIAAMVVVVFHFLCLMHPAIVPDMHDSPPWVSDSPVAVLWNGPFAVSVFFVLSGFVIAGSADRRQRRFVTNVVSRYIRLAIPATASTIFAWAILSSFPDATTELQKALSEPSRWLAYTYQNDIPALSTALYEGLIKSFLQGKSDFNNVLWTLRIELIGSIGVYAIYALLAKPRRVVALSLAGIALIVLDRPVYIAFVLGALLYETHARRLFETHGHTAPLIALGVGVVFGAAGRGLSERLGLPDVPSILAIDNKGGLVPIVAAALITYAALTLSAFRRILGTKIPQELGRLSFAIYLVHVPILYTMVAFAYVHLEWRTLLLAPLYLTCIYIVASGITRYVDRPTLRVLSRWRANFNSRAV